MKNKTFRITLTALLSSLAFALMFIEISLPVIPAFIKFDISDLPALIGALSIGPVCGVLIELLKNILHILLKGSQSAFIGELSNFILGSVFCLVAGIIYKPGNKKKIAFALVISALAMGALSIPINYFIVYPAFVKCYNMPLNVIIGMYEEILPKSAEFPSNNSLFNCLLIFNFPFTFIKGLIDALLCLTVLTPISKAVRKFK